MTWKRLIKAYHEVEDDGDYDYVRLKLNVRSSVYLSFVAWRQGQTKDGIENLRLLYIVYIVYVIPAV